MQIDLFDSMMKDAKTIISGIEYKVRKLTEELQKIKDLNKQLNLRIEQQQTELTEQEKKIRIIENKNQILELSQFINQDEGKEEIKIRLNNLVGEIDKCLSLMNTK